MPGLVERDDEMALLLTLAHAGEGRLVLLSGEAGAGKTTLLRAWRERLGDRCRAMMGRCEPLATPTPLGPLFEVLPSFPDHVAELLVGGGQRVQLFAAVLEELSAVRSVLVLDDVHFADEATVDLIRYLGRRIEDTPSVLVAAYRPGQVGLRDAGRQKPAGIPSVRRGMAPGDRRWRAPGGAAAYVGDVASTFQPDLTDPACGVPSSGVDERRAS